jgi:hypothetical protein
MKFEFPWLRHYATSRKDVGTIPDDVTVFFNLPKYGFEVDLASDRNEYQESS